MSRRVLAFIVLLASVATSAVFAEAKISPEDAVAAYADAWAEADEAKRRTLLEKAWADDGVYSDPTALVVGREALIQHIAGFIGQQGAGLERTSAVDVHHDVLRFEWHIKAPDGSIVAKGFDYGELAEDGRLQKIVGFFGPFPPLE